MGDGRATSGPACASCPSPKSRKLPHPKRTIAVQPHRLKVTSCLFWFCITVISRRCLLSCSRPSDAVLVLVGLMQSPGRFIEKIEVTSAGSLPRIKVGHPSHLCSQESHISEGRAGEDWASLAWLFRHSDLCGFSWHGSVYYRTWDSSVLSATLVRLKEKFGGCLGRASDYASMATSSAAPA